jgi:glycosyltransferase involved in cell wall biosynthesis
VQIDADLSHDPAALPELLAEIERGADAAIGSRYVPGGSIPHWPWYRRAVSKWGNRYATLVLGLPVRDATSGYRAFRVDTLKAADYANTRSKGYGFQIELCYRIWQYGGRIAQVPIAFTDRVRGHSKMSLSVGAEELGLVTWWALQDRVLKGRWRR